MLKKIVEAYTRASIKLYIPVLLVVIGATWLAYPRCISLFKNIQTDFASLLPEGYPSVQRLGEVTDIFGNLKNLTIVIETKDPARLKAAIPELAKYLEKDPMVKEVDWRKRGYDFFNVHKLFFPSTRDLEDLKERIDRRIQREKLGGLYIEFDEEEKKPDTFDDLKQKYADTYSGKITSEFYTDEDETVFLVNLFPAGEKMDVSYFKKFSEDIRGKIKEFHLEERDPTSAVYYTGGVITSTHEFDSLTRDLKVAGIISGTLMLSLIMLYFRKVRALLFVFGPLACGLLWTFAVAWETIGHLNMTTAFLFSIISGLGMDFGILLNSRYYEERAGGKGLHEAISSMLYNSGRSSFTAGITTSAAFLVLMINDFKGFTEFGWIAGLGVMMIFAAYIIVLPALRTLESKIPFMARRTFSTTNLRLGGLARLPQRAMVITLIAVTAVSIPLSLFMLRFDFDFTNFRAPNPELEMAQKLEHRVNPQKAAPSVVLVHSREEAESAKKALEEIRDRNPGTYISSARNVYSLVPKDQESKIPIMREIGNLLQDDVIEKLVKGEDKERIEELKESAAANPYTIDEVPSSIKDFFVDKKSGEDNQLVFIFLKSEVDLKNGKIAMALANDIRDIKAGDGKVFHAVSSSVIFADVLKVMLDDSPIAIALSFAAIFVLVLLDFRNIKQSLIAMIPLFGGITLMLGILGATGVHMNFFNMIVIPVMLGMGVDCGVHMFHRFKEEGYANMPKVLATTGGSIVITTLTTVAGFSGMIVAHHGGLSSIGIAATIGLFSILVVNLLFYPAVLSTLFGRRSSKEPPEGR